MSYTSEKIFAEERVNNILDYLFTKLVEKFPATIPDPDNDYVYKGLLLTGKASAIMQGATNVEIKNITLQVDDELIYNFLYDIIPKLFNCKVIIFKERILFYPFDLFFEIWLTPGDLKPILNTTVYVQDTIFIPTETL